MAAAICGEFVVVGLVVVEFDKEEFRDLYWCAKKRQPQVPDDMYIAFKNDQLCLSCLN